MVFSFRSNLRSSSALYTVTRWVFSTESDLTRVHCSTAALDFFSSSYEELLSDDDDASAPETQSDGNVV